MRVRERDEDDEPCDRTRARTRRRRRRSCRPRRARSTASAASICANAAGTSQTIARDAIEADSGGQPSREHLADRAREHERQQRRRDRDHEQRGGERHELRRQASLERRARQVRHDHEPRRLRGEHDHEVDAVRREEAVGLRVAAELVRQVRACDRRRRADGEARGARSGAAPNGARAEGQARLSALDAHGLGELKQRPSNLVRRSARGAPRAVRRVLRRPNRARDRRRRIHGLASHRCARRARRSRPRVRARDVERRAEQHRAPAQRG